MASPVSTRSPVSYLTADSPVGPLLLAATDGAVVRLAFADADRERLVAELSTRVGPQTELPAPVLDQAVSQLAEYFAGRRQGFALPLDLRLSTGFRRAVQQFLPSIGYGRTLTYAQVAAAVGSPRAVRAVGSACATNPLAIFVPCHRVLRTDGKPGGYAGGLQAKRLLLALERDHAAS